MVKAPTTVETARLRLQQPRLSDAAAIFERYSSDTAATRFLSWPRHRSVRDTEAFLQYSAQEWDRWPAGPYLIWSLADNQLLGSTGFAFEDPQHAVTGYVLARDAWGKGFATEVLAEVVNIARQIGVRRLSASCHPLNRASWRVLEKCGFMRASATERAEFPNLVPDVTQDVLTYSLDL